MSSQQQQNQPTLLTEVILSQIPTIMASRFLSKEILNGNDKTPAFSLDGEMKYGKVVSVYDGDTCKVVMDIGGLVKRMSVRMYGYDSPELRKKEKGAVEAKERLQSLILDKIVLLECMKFDKYGRLLARLHLVSQPRRLLCCLFLPPKFCCFGTHLEINELMVKEGHGYPYFGGTKGKNAMKDKKSKGKKVKEEQVIVDVDETNDAAVPWKGSDSE